MPRFVRWMEEHLLPLKLIVVIMGVANFAVAYETFPRHPLLALLAFTMAVILWLLAVLT